MSDEQPPGPRRPGGDGRAEAQGAAYDLFAGSRPAGAHDDPRPRPAETPEEGNLADAGALAVLRRGLRVTPELRRGLGFTAGLALATAAGKLAVPVLIQQALDRGVLGDAGFRPAFVYGACAATAALVLALYLVSRAAYLRLVTASESSLFGLRVRTFDHIHRLSMAEHEEHRRGALVARVTSDVETLAQFMEWGAVAWVVDTLLVAATFGVMLAYDWRLALLAMAAFAPLVVLFPVLQRRQLAAQDRVRTAVGDTISEVAEAVSGAAVIRAYGLEERARRGLGRAADRQYRAHMRAARYLAMVFPLGDLFGAVALALVAAVGVVHGPGWGLGVGELVALLFLVGLLLHPLTELSEIMDHTQIALAGWRKVLGVLATPIEVLDPSPGLPLPEGALAVAVRGLSFAYRGGPTVLDAVDAELPAGASVAVVGETGSGKTTFARLLCRLADPVAGAIEVGGLDLRDVAAGSRQHAIRLVPQDVFLFDATIADNVRAGRLHASDDEVHRAFADLGLGWWVDGLDHGLATVVGERGTRLSAGERQLVALARAHLGDPGLLVLDEATSAVDSETERALARALGRLAEGRTMVAIAHRLATAEAADLVLVFDRGRIVERGRHADLVAAGGTYARLYGSWLGTTDT